MSGAAEQLFTVRAAASPPSKGSWKVIVRAADPAAAAARVWDRGNVELDVISGAPAIQTTRGVTRAMPECAVCGYPLKDLPAEETLEVTCPECGTVNLGIELPKYDDRPHAAHTGRTARWFAYGVGGTIIVVLLLLALSRL